MNTNVQTGMPTSGQSPMGLILVLALVGLVVCGGYALSQLLTVGHTAYNTDSRGIFWGLPIVTYDFFLLSSTGLMMLASAWMVFGIEDFKPIARRAVWLSVAALTGGVAALFMELSYPLRALFTIPFSGAIEAPLFWKVWGIIVYVVMMALLILNWLAKKDDVVPPKIPALIAFLAAIYITFVAGGLYGWMAMRPFWFGGEISLAFIVEALLGAVTFVIIFTHVAHGFDSSRFDSATRSLFEGKLASLFAAVIVAHALFVVSRLVAGLWTNAEGMEIWHYLWSRPIFHLELWVGIGLPLLITLSPGLKKSMSLQLVAAGVALVALFAARYDFVIGGQLVPSFKGSWVHGLLSYTPSLTEWAVLAAAVFLANVVNALGEKQLSLGAERS
jgi:Ni/Fe-hydrogenase subunit HybB-like protein